MSKQNTNKTIAMMGGKTIDILSFDMREFTLSTYFFLLKRENAAVMRKATNKQLLKKALINYYKPFKLFKTPLQRKFVLNAIFVMELLISGLPFISPRLIMDQFLTILSFDPVKESEINLLESTFSAVAQSLEQATVETHYAHWLETLAYAEGDDTGLLIRMSRWKNNPPPIQPATVEDSSSSEELYFAPDEELEQQMFSTSTKIHMSDEMKNTSEEILSILEQFPGKPERDQWRELISEQLPKRSEWNQFMNASKKVSEAVPSVKQACFNLSQLREQFSDISKKFDSLKSTTNDVATNAMDLLYCSIVGWALLRYSKDSSLSNLTLLAAMTTLALTQTESRQARVFLVSSGISTIVPLVGSLFSGKNKENEEIEIQSLNLPEIGAFLSSLSSFISGIKWVSLPRKLLDVIRLSKELPTFINEAVKVVRGFINDVWIYVFKTPLFSKDNSLRPDYVSNLKNIYSKYSSDRLTHSFEEASEVRSLIEETRILLNQCKSYGDRKILDGHLRVLQEIDKELSDVRYTMGGSRQEPVVILLEGPPGTKKTVWSRLVASAIVNAVKGSDEEVDKNIYVKPAGDYWSQYKNQLVTSFDDFGQIRDSVGDPREKGELINMYNSVPFPLNMNENEDKGKTYFTSPFVVLTANEAWDESPSILSKKALQRRIDIKVKVCLLNNDTKINSTGIELIQPENYKFIVQTLTDDSFKSLTFQQLIDTIMRCYNIKSAHYKTFKLIQNNIIKDVSFSEDIEKDTREEIDAVYEKLSSLYGVGIKNNIEQQTGAEDIKMDYVMESLEANRLILNSCVKDIKIPLGPLREGEKIFDDKRFRCQYFDDVDELTYNAAIDLMQGYCGELAKNFTIADYKLDEMSLNYLKLHYGEKRTQLFLKDYIIAKNLFGDMFIDIFRPLSYKLTREQKGYYFTEMTLLMSIWSVDRTKFFECFFNPSVVTADIIPSLGINEATPLTDFGLFFRRVTKKINDNINAGFSEVTRVYAECRASLASKALDTYGVMLNVDNNVWLTWLERIAIIGGVVGLLTPMIYIMSKMGLDKWWKTLTKQSSQPYFKAGKQPESKTTIKQLIRDASLKKQSNSTVPIITKLENSSATLTVVSGGDICCLGKTFFIDSNHLLVPLHFYSDILESQEAKFELFDGDVKVSLTFEDMITNTSIIETEHLELVIVKLPKQKKERKNCLQNFMTRDQISKLTSVFQVGLYPYTENEVLVTGKAYVDKLRVSDSKTIPKMVKYNIDTGKGDCGSMVYVMSSNLGSSIICGMHEAGTPKGAYNKTGAAFIISREDIIEALAAFDTDEFEKQGNTPSHMPLHSPYGRSKIVPSPISEHPLVKPQKFPAKLMPNKELDLDPFEIGIKKYKKYPMNPNSEVLSRAANQVINELTSFEYVPKYGSVVPYDKCFYGDPNLVYQKAIPTSTSCGYPYKFIDRYMKENMKEQGPEGEAFCKFVLNLEKMENLMAKGIRCDFIHTANLKDETRPKEKVESYSTRVFFGTPIDLCMLTKRYFGEFVIFMMEDCVEKGTAMSVNPHSYDWKSIVHRLSRLAPSYDLVKCQDFDYSHFDGSNNPVVLNEVLRIINYWYTHMGLGEHNNIRKLLFKEISSFKYVVMDKIVEMETALPSGSFLTLLVNCLTNKMLVRYAFYRHFPSLSYEDYMVDIVLGDDNVISIADDISSHFTPVHVASYVSELGFEMTSGDKTSVKSRWANLKEVTFLKRKFSIDELKEVRAPLDPVTIWNTMCWSKKGILYEQILIDNIEFFYREFSQHGREVFVTETSVLRGILQDFPQFNKYPFGKAYDWRYWDRLVRNTPIYVSHEL